VLVTEARFKDKQMGVEIINIKRKPASGGGKVNGASGGKANVHTVKGEDLRIHKPIVGQGGLSMVLKLK
jgi:glutathione synthase/RimK-type ligase-like ATP-grasp enzyme